MTEIAIGIAVTVGGASIVGAVAWLVSFYRLVVKMSNQLSSLVSVNSIQSDNIIVLKKAWIEVIKALRSHSYAFKELKANGSTDRALQHIGIAESIMNGCDEANAEAAMKATEKSA